MRPLIQFVVGVGALVFAASAVSESPFGRTTAFGDVEKGRDFFGQRCSVCHGVDGRGKNGIAPDFSLEWQRLTKTDAQLADNIRNEYRSGQGNYMAESCPQHLISDEEMQDLLAYLRQMSESLRASEAFGRDPMREPAWPDDLNRPGGGFGRPDDFDQPGGFNPRGGDASPFGMDRR